MPTNHPADTWYRCDGASALAASVGGAQAHAAREGLSQQALSSCLRYGGNLACFHNSPPAKLGDAAPIPNLVGRHKLGECAKL